MDDPISAAFYARVNPENFLGTMRHFMARRQNERTHTLAERRVFIRRLAVWTSYGLKMDLRLLRAQ